ncbi:MAG: transglutaminase family protein [Actinomycetota bacterium]|nr:transglutaminase family protein [Actinomycetota bacterium]MDQ2848050.1 transglutaminase family protein [Actinomycetota bacterium]MDQ2957612.1 transglutaminase family protein [Actinomycetota bacterium]
MTWRVRVRHRTGYSYDGAVGASYNEARMTPLTDSNQTTLDSRVEISPLAGTHRYRDYWGTEVTAFDIHTPHSELEVVATSVVETGLRPWTPGGLEWADLHSEPVRDQYAEWLASTARTDPDGTLAALAAERLDAGSPTEVAISCLRMIGEHLEYVPGSTDVGTSAMQAWQERNGVCQDFAHISLAMLRSVGIPARYVSGYLHPNADALIGHTTVGESHAWVEWWDGDWVGYDPTNGKPMGEQHVLVARGRDYDDVAPLKGIYSGPKSSALGVLVEVTRLA